MSDELLSTEIAPADDIRADVAAAFAAVSDKSEQAAATSDDGVSQRLRNERGQFASSEGAEPGDTENLNTDADELQDNVQEASPAQLVPPKGWSADEKAMWASLDPAIQAAVARRETEADNGGRQWSEQRRAYDEMLTPVRGLAQRNGVHESEAITRLVEASEWLERDPTGFISAYAQHYGIDLNNPQQQTNRPQAQSDPQFAQLYQTVAQIQGSLAQREEQEIQSVLTTFKSEAGHEHFDTVKVEMGRLMQIDPSLTLSDAYDKAIWSNKDVRSQLLAQQAAPQQRDRDRQQVARARASAVSPRGSGPNGAAPTAKKEYASINDTVRAAFNGEI